jgi:hypothetical protein
VSMSHLEFHFPSCYRTQPILSLSDSTMSAAADHSPDPDRSYYSWPCSASMMQPGLFEVDDGDCGGCGGGGHAPCGRVVVTGYCLAAGMIVSADGGSCGVTVKKKSYSLLFKDEERRCYLKSSHLNLSFNHGQGL